ncbi:hypothetical protein J4480_05695 [Candidatus Woesearchaeota archaeon]|nr:hypothetical protein [Candidatus Woesearchaeota archaeon]
MEKTKDIYKTIKYFKASQLSDISKSEEANKIIQNSDPNDNVAVLLSINSPIKAEKAVNITKDGFEKVRELVI